MMSKKLKPFALDPIIRQILDNRENPCSCSCHLANEQNCICYSCECDFNKMPSKQNTITLDNFN